MKINRRAFLAVPPAAAVALAQARNAPSTQTKARKQIATWLVYDEEKSMERIRGLAEILTSLSIFGNPPREFFEECHQLKIELYRCVSGNASAFESPARSQATIDVYLRDCKEGGYDGIDLDFEHLDPALQDQYSEFMRKTSAALHAAGKKMSHCVGYYPGMELDPPRRLFYDPAVVAETCDLVRVMCYDLYWAPGKGKGGDRDDAQGIGPTSNYPWARTAMQFWVRRAPREKVIMGLPAYGNDYVMTTDGPGKQVYRSTPDVPPGTKTARSWLWYEKLNLYLYSDASGNPHGFYASDARSTQAHLETVDELDLPGIGFWHFSSVDEKTWAAVREWLKSGKAKTD